MTICFSMTIGAHILIDKIDCYNKCANCWLCGCEELCAKVAIFTRMWTRCGRCIILGQVSMKLHRLYFW